MGSPCPPDISGDREIGEGIAVEFSRGVLEHAIGQSWVDHERLKKSG